MATGARLEASDCILLFADLQQGIADLPLTQSAKRLAKGVHLAKLAKLFDIPILVTAIPGPDGKATLLPELEEELNAIPIHFRSTADSLRNEEIAGIIAKSGRKTLLLSGVATELAVQLPALTGIDLGYRTVVVIDACAGTSERTENAAIQRITQHGGSTVSVLTLAGELAGDLRQPKAQQAVGILFAMAKE